MPLSRLTLLLPFLFALALPVHAQQPERARLLGDETGTKLGTCRGPGCCRNGSSEPGKVCVRKHWWRVPEAGDISADAGKPFSLYAITRVLEGKQASKLLERAGKPATQYEQQFYGFADTDNRTLTKPDKLWMLPLSSRHAVTDTGLLDMKTDKEKPWTDTLQKPSVFSFPAEKRVIDGREQEVIPYPAIVSVTRRHANGKRADIAFLDLAGNVIRQLPDVVWGSTRPQVNRLGRHLIINVQGPDESEPSALFTTARGEVLSKGGPVRTFRMSLHNVGKSRDFNVVSQNESQARMIGEWPQSFDTEYSVLYQPIDAEGNALPLTDGVLGLLPVRSLVKPDATFAKGCTCANGWIIVEMHDSGVRYRIGQGYPDEVLARRHELALINEIQTLPGANLFHGQGAPYWSSQKQLLVRRASDGTWLLPSLHHPEILPESGRDLLAAAPAGKSGCTGEEWGIGIPLAGLPRYSPLLCAGPNPQDLVIQATAHGQERRQLVEAVSAGFKKSLADAANASAAQKEANQAALQKRYDDHMRQGKSWDAGAYQAAVQLGGIAFVTFVDRFGPSSDWDVEAYCSYRGNRCDTLRRQAKGALEQRNREAAMRNQKRLWDVYTPTQGKETGLTLVPGSEEWRQKRSACMMRSTADQVAHGYCDNQLNLR